MPRQPPSPPSLLSQCRWALALFLALLLATVGFFWLLGHDLQMSRVAETKPKAAAKAAK